MTGNPCNLCPRQCAVDRTNQTGYCLCPSHLKVARAALHFWEEPCISGKQGSGTIFFSGCNLRCCFCQNYQISSEGAGVAITVERLADICLELQEAGAHNINLVTATPYLPWILSALDIAKPRLHIPIVYNCGGYERAEVIKALQPYIDIYLPDLKYFSNQLAWRYSRCDDYFETSAAAIQAMVAQCGQPQFDQNGIMLKGVMIRHLVLPGARHDSIKIMQWLNDYLPRDKFMLSLMSQYTPVHNCRQFNEINRKITSLEYDSVVNAAMRLGLTNGYIQDRGSANQGYIPPFNLAGI